MQFPRHAVQLTESLQARVGSSRAVSLRQDQADDIRHIGSYLVKNGFDKDKLSLPSVYHMAVVVAGELHERNRTSSDVVVVPQRAGRKSRNINSG